MVYDFNVWQEISAMYEERVIAANHKLLTRCPCHARHTGNKKKRGLRQTPDRTRLKLCGAHGCTRTTYSLRLQQKFQRQPAGSACQYATRCGSYCQLMITLSSSTTHDSTSFFTPKATGTSLCASPHTSPAISVCGCCSSIASTQVLA